MRALTITIGLTGLLAANATALADCPGPEEIRRYIDQWQARQPAKALPVSDMKDAACARDRIVEALGGTLGKVIGYEAGIVAKASQERFNATAAASGVLLERMILQDGATVPANYGPRGV